MEKTRIFVAIALLPACCACIHPKEEELRDPLKQPFASTSIWNMPIGDQAEYVHAHLIVPDRAMVTVDEDYIFLNPDLPEVDVYLSDGNWGDDNTRRCVSTTEKKLMARLPLPKDFIVSPDTWEGRIPNGSTAVLLKDKRYIYQGQPYAHCTEDGEFTIGFSTNFSGDHPEGYVDIYGDGIYGGHGASGLSSIGGTLRIHDLTPTSGPIRHALKMNVYAALNLYYDHQKDCGYRWPARSDDGYAGEGRMGMSYGTIRPNDSPVVKECLMGSLLALHPSFDIAVLRTEPARILAQAFMDYGAYIVDDTAWNALGVVVEWSPEGRFTDEFRKNWGFSFIDPANGKYTSSWSAWAKDIMDIFANLHVVVNNTEDNIGGPGNRRVPMAAQLKIIE